MLSRSRAAAAVSVLSVLLFAQPALAQQSTHSAAEFYALPANAADTVGVVAAAADPEPAQPEVRNLVGAPAPTSRAFSSTSSRGAQSASGNEQRARERFEAGVRLADRLQWSEAADAFEESYRLLPRPGTLRNLGLAHRAMGRYMRALEELQRFLSDAQPPPDVAMQVNTIINEMRGQVATITVVPSVTSGVQLTLDNQPVQPNEEILADPGNHVVAATATGYVRAAQTFTVQRAEHRRVDLRLERTGGVPIGAVVGSTVGGVVLVAAIVLIVVLASHEEPPNCGTLNVCVSPQ